MKKKGHDWEKLQVDFYKAKLENSSLSLESWCNSVGISYASAKRHLKARWSPSGEPMPPPVSQRSKLTNGKHDYHSLYDRYLAMKLLKQNLSVAAFAKECEIPVRNLQMAFKKIEHERNSHESHCEIAKELRNSQSNKTKKASGDKGSSAKECEEGRERTRKLKREIRTSAELVIGTIAHDSHEMFQHGRDRGGRFLPGHKISTRHGAYMKIAQIDQRIIDTISEFDLLDLTPELAASRSRILAMHEIIAMRQKELIQQYADGNPILDAENNIVPLSQELGRIAFGTTDKLNAAESSAASLASTLLGIEIEREKLRLKAWALPALSSTEIAHVTAEIMNKKQVAEWTAIRTVEEFELNGIKPPPFLLAMAKKELDSIEPEVDDHGISDDELDAITEEYQRKSKEYESETLPKRREGLLTKILEQEAKENGELEYEDDSDDLEQGQALIETEKSLDDLFNGLEGHYDEN